MSSLTSHIPLREVAESITVEGVRDACVLLDSLLRANGVDAPRLGVAALNPHGGENGRFGDEESRQIAPGVALADESGVNARGPFPADTIFMRAFDGEYDGVVTMFHDQGQIALKTRSFHGGVTLEAGLPFPIATPAHGTAFDLVGSGRADLTSMQRAYETVRRLARKG